MSGNYLKVNFPNANLLTRSLKVPFAFSMSARTSQVADPTRDDAKDAEMLYPLFSPLTIALQRCLFTALYLYFAVEASILSGQSDALL